MKVLLISTWKPKKGGIVTHVQNLIEHSKNNFTILTYSDPNANPEPNVIRVPIINLPLFRGLTFALSATLKGLNSDADLIHAHYAIPQGVVGALLKKIRKKPLILTVHGSDLMVLGKNPLMRLILKWVISSADHILAVSSFLKNELHELGADEARVSVVHNGVDKKQAPSGSEKRIIFIGSLVWQKGVDILLEAYSSINELKEDVELLIVGDGPEKRKLIELSKKLELNDVEFKGYVEDLSPLFTKNSVLVLPSRAEGFGIVILEAMAMGVPVIASRVGGIPEIIVNEENGLLFEPESVKNLRDYIIKMFEESDLRKKLAKNGLKRAGDFTWDHAVKEIDDVYTGFEKTGA